MTAIRAGFQQGLATYRRVYADPAVVEGGLALDNRIGWYALLWAYYDNSAFESVTRWSAYKGQHRLYRQMRSIYNPTRRLVDFYAGQLYPGLVTANPRYIDEQKEQVSLALPLPDDLAQPIKAGLDQLWKWSKWQAGKTVLCRYGAATGNVLLEVLDDPERGMVALNVVWPGNIAEIDLDPAGHIEMYVVQYQTTDDNGYKYIYRKEVDAAQVRTFKNGQPYDYTGAGATYANPYGFVPAVWIKHKDIGSDYGMPAIYGSVAKIDELNSLASHIHDQVHKVVNAPLLLSGDGAIQNLFSAKGEQKRAGTDPFDLTDTDREGLLMLKGPSGTTAVTLAGDLPLQEAALFVDRLILEIEQDHPELASFREMREMSQLTGPAASRVMGDVVQAVQETAAIYDAGVTQACSMALAIGGWRASLGDWGHAGSLSKRQQAFTPFGLDDYLSGDLDWEILPRPLIPLTQLEKIELETAQLALDAQKAGTAQDLIQTSATGPPPAPRVKVQSGGGTSGAGGASGAASGGQTQGQGPGTTAGGKAKGQAAGNSRGPNA